LLVNQDKTTNRRAAAFATLAGSTANTVIVAVQALVLTPLCLHFVGARLYGAWLASGDFLVWLQALDLGLPNLLIQRIGRAAGAQDDRTIGEYFATGSVVLLGLGAACLAVGITLSWSVASWLNLTGVEATELTRCFQLGVLAVSILLVNNAVVGLARGLQDTVWINACVVVAALIGFATSAALIVTGFGLWSIPLGMAARTAVTVVGSGIYLWIRVRASIWQNLRLSRNAAMDVSRVSPATTFAGFSYATLTQCDNLLTGIVLGPEIVPILALTRKGADLIRAVLDPISYSSYAGFAHLMGSSDRSRARRVHAEISSIRLSLAIAASVVFIGVNRQLVALWVGPDQFGGLVLTVCVALHSLVVGTSYLMNSLYRATGEILRGSIALIVEAIVRVPLTILGLLTLGLAGPALAGMATGLVATVVVKRWTDRVFDTCSEVEGQAAARTWFARAVMLFVGVTVAFVPGDVSWASMVTRALGLSVVAVLFLLWSDPALAKTLRDVRRLAGRGAQASVAVA
jgi:O-antigen/teichoic acid export membrane protein